MRRSLRLYRWLLRLYPAGFREEYSGALERHFKDEYGEVRGTADLVRFWTRTLSDFVRSMPGSIAREVLQDTRYALRLWRQHPFHTAFVVGVLAIAIGANVGVFSVLNAVALVHDAGAAASATSMVAALVTVLVAVAATWLGTRRLARLDVTEVLRAECAD